MSAAIASLVGYGVSNEVANPGPRPYSVTSITFSVIASPRSTSSYYTGTLGVLNGDVLVGDDTDEYATGAGGQQSTSTDLCRLAVVQPEPLQLASNRLTNCDNPLLAGQRVVPVETIEKGGDTGDVRISALESADAFRVGPIVMRYGNYSDTRPEWTYGGGYLWIFDAKSPSGTEVLRVSESTGAVLSTVHLPWSARVLLAADEDGLWIGQSAEGGWQRGEKLPLLELVGDRARAPIVALQSPQPLDGGRVDWLAAFGHTAIAAVSDYSRSTETSIDTLQGPTGHPLIVKTGNAWQPTNIGEGPFDAPPVLEAPGIGLVAAMPGWDGQFSETPVSESVLRIDPLTGRDSRLALLKDLAAEDFSAYVFYDDALYLLAHANGMGTATLYRIQM